MKTASPEMLEAAPNDLPLKIGPSLLFDQQLSTARLKLNYYSDGKSGSVVGFRGGSPSARSRLYSRCIALDGRKGTDMFR